MKRRKLILSLLPALFVLLAIYIGSYVIPDYSPEERASSKDATRRA